ncbi:hypothetical protein QJS66_23485 (plasmid) [Kocuria rhizophila]|nr:hypothetical protein QJS66_23485 [Kocuria rhizophila]
MAFLAIALNYEAVGRVGFAASWAPESMRVYTDDDLRGSDHLAGAASTSACPGWPPTAST